MHRYLGFASSKQGYNHIRINKICQDASGFEQSDKMSVIVVADGHGSDNYIRTDRGSKYAVKAALDSIQLFLEDAEKNNISILDNPEDCLKQITKNILAEWHDQVEHDVQREPFQQEEMQNVSAKYQRRYLAGEINAKAYGTTLIVVCTTAAYWFGIQIGDGKCVEILRDGEIVEPVPWDSQCEMNVTTSICDSDAFDEFRYAWGTEAPAAFFIGSDGIEDSYTTEQELHELYRSIFEIYIDHGETIVKDEVEAYLPKISQQGSGDDVSIAGLICAELTKAEQETIVLHGKRIRAEMALKQAAKRHQSALDRREYISSGIEKNRREYQSLFEKLSRIEQEIRDTEGEYSQAEKEYNTIQMKLKNIVPIDEEQTDFHMQNEQDLSVAGTLQDNMKSIPCTLVSINNDLHEMKTE